MFIEYNPNPRLINTGDCVIRAICKALDTEWEKVYMALTVKGLEKAMWGDTNAVWEKYLKEHGFEQHVIPEGCTVTACPADVTGMTIPKTAFPAGVTTTHSVME